MEQQKIPLLIKVLLLHVIFILLHYLYDWFPHLLTSLFSGINESIYQHMKIGFFAYLMLAVAEYFWMRKNTHALDRHIYARIFSAVLLPLFMMVIYLIGPLVFGQFKSMLAEIVFANLALLATSLSTFVVEAHLEKAVPALGFKIVAVSLFLIALAQFILFTFHLPWFDIFTIPPGW
jgi:hypothetical protein